MARVWVDELGRYLYDEEWEHYRDAKLARAYMSSKDREKEIREKIEAERRESDLRREEEDRRKKLKKHCAEHDLDFDVENRKYVHNWYHCCGSILHSGHYFPTSPQRIL